MHRHGARLLPAGLAALVLLVALCAPAGAASFERRPTDTWFQTIRFGDGSAARLTVTTRTTPPAAGEGVDLGTVDAAGTAATATAQLPSESRPGTRAAGGTGAQTAWGWVNYTSYAGIELWRWLHQISWSYAAYRVTGVSNQIAASLNSCCLWDYNGLLTAGHGPPGGPNFTAYAQGRYKQCLTSILCQTKAPWVWLQGNGNGYLTGFSWGIG
jgi:hypothetical protein